MTENLDAALEAISKEAELTAKTDAAYADAEKQWKEITLGYKQLRGTVLGDDAKNLIQKWGPKALQYLGVPGGAGLATWFSDPGAFAGLAGALKSLIPVVAG